MFKMTQHWGKIIYLLSFFTLIIGFYLGEDGTGRGLTQDFYSTWKFVEALKYDFFADPSEITLHFPLHYFLLSKLNYLISDLNHLRFFYMIVSSLMPFFLYIALKIKFKNVDKNILLILSSIIFFIPAFRYSAIWANDHITSGLFFLVSLIFYLKWEEERINKYFNINIFFQILFMALASYSRQYYAMFFIFLLIKYFNNLNFKNFLICLIISILLSLPGIFYLLKFPVLFTRLEISSNFSNSILANASMLSIYIFPILLINIINKNLFLKKNIRFLIFISFLSVILTAILSQQFDDFSQFGYGIFYKLSNILLSNNIIFFITSTISLFFIFYVSRENIYNFFLSILLIFGFSGSILFQKYFEPLFFIMFFLIFKSSLITVFEKNIKNSYILLIYYILYTFVAITDLIYKI